MGELVNQLITRRRRVTFCHPIETQQSLNVPSEGCEIVKKMTLFVRKTYDPDSGFKPQMFLYILRMYTKDQTDYSD